MSTTGPATSASIVIPTTMRRDTVAPVVEAAVEAIADVPDGEVIVVANGPAEDRLPLDVRSPNLRVVECAAPRASAARNMGLREAENDVVLFTDDDCLISREWVDGLTARLRGGEVAVATPLDTRHAGPVTTFLDYQRIFHPRPIDASTAYYGLGASLGIRRDQTAVEFDEDLAWGDDVQFGTRLREAGISIAYETEVPLPVHVLTEGVESLAARFYRYGASNAAVYQLKDRPEVSIPNAASLYSSLCRNQIETPRRFEELADPDLREYFATLERVLLGALLVGYLAEAGRILDRQIIRVDHEGLTAGWLGIESRLESEFAWGGDWNRLPVDIERLFTPRETTPPALADEVSEKIHRNTTLMVDFEPDPDLERSAELIERRSEEIWATANEIFAELREGRMPAETDAVAARMRESGISFREGMQTMEAIALGPVRLSARA
jgi:glycosyltransferase involved in cell wall biosynthesis